MKWLSLFIIFGMLLLPVSFAAHGDVDMGVGVSGDGTVDSDVGDVNASAEVIGDGSVDDGGLSANGSSAGAIEVEVQNEDDDDNRQRSDGQARARSDTSVGASLGGVDVGLGVGMKVESRDNGSIIRFDNGRNASIKVLPVQASARAREALRLNACNAENNCSISLKQVGSGSETRAAYEVKARQKARVLGLFNTEMDVSTEIDAETGQTIDVDRPWWSFMASTRVSSQASASSES